MDFVAKRSRTLDPAYFGLQPRYALFCPAGDESLPAQRWPKERWASLAHELRQKGVEPVIVGGPSTRELGRYIAHITPGTRDLTGRANLIQLAGLGRQASAPLARMWRFCTSSWPPARPPSCFIRAKPP